MPAPAAPGAYRRNDIASRLLLLAPLLVCIGCLALAFVSQRIYQRQKGASPVPITGEEFVPPNQPLPALPRATDPGPAPQHEEPLPPALAYRSEVDRVLAACYPAFHQFYLFEEVMVSEPAIMGSDRWVAEAQDAADTFQTDCQALGDLPDAPVYYAEVDRWLKMAAGEVAPAAESFARALGSREAARTQREEMRRAIEHMMNFIEYTHNAEAALSSMDDRREI